MSSEFPFMAAGSRPGPIFVFNAPMRSEFPKIKRKVQQASPLPEQLSTSFGHAGDAEGGRSHQARLNVFHSPLPVGTDLLQADSFPHGRGHVC